MMLALMMPITTLAYDERSKWDRYAAMLPYSPEQIVWRASCSLVHFRTAYLSSSTSFSSHSTSFPLWRKAM